MIRSISRPARLSAAAVVALWFLWFWFVYAREGPETLCLVPVSSQQQPHGSANETNIGDAAFNQTTGAIFNETLPLNGTEAADGAAFNETKTEEQILIESQHRNASRVGKVTVAANKLNSPLVDRAMKSHDVQNKLHGYPHFIAPYEAVSDLIEYDRQNRAKGAWTKPAYMLSVLVAELEKPEDERLEWLFWFDADTVVMNPQTPLEIFLPPMLKHPVLENVCLLMASNWDGLNSGAFGLRVDPWSASLLSAVLAYPIYEDKKYRKDRFRDQSAFQWLLEGVDSPLALGPTKGRDRWVTVPMRWFNSLPFNNAFNSKGEWILAKNMTTATFDNGTTQVYKDGQGPVVREWKIMQGDMIAHFAGSSDVRHSWMTPWLDRAEEQLPEWANVTTQYDLRPQIDAFWDQAADVMKYRTEKSGVARLPDYVNGASGSRAQSSHSSGGAGAGSGAAGGAGGRVWGSGPGENPTPLPDSPYRVKEVETVNPDDLANRIPATGGVSQIPPPPPRLKGVINGTAVFERRRRR